MKKINLLHITHDLNYGGLQKLLVDLCSHTDKNKFNISVLCLRELGPLTNQIQDLGIKVDLLPQKKNTNYFSFWDIKHFLNKNNIDIIHTHNSQPFMEGTIASILSGGHKIIHTDHGRDFPDKKRYMLMERFASFIVDRVIAVSEKTAQDLEKYIKINKNKIKVIENGVDGTRYENIGDKNELRKELQLAEDDFVLGFVGRFVYEKGLNYLIKAMADLVKQYPKLKLVLVGDGPKREEIEKLVNQFKLNGFVRLPGLRSDTHLFYNMFDLFVLASVSEGLPLVLLESMAAKCPVLATKVGGIPNVIKHGHSGYLVDSKNSEHLAEGIEYLYKNFVQKKNYTKKAYEFFKQNYDISSTVKKYEKEYTTILLDTQRRN